MHDIELITTSDGSHSLLNTKLRETYHSVHGAIQESVHVYIKNGLHFFDHHHHRHEIKILEIGFGTGLNALLSLQFAMESNIRIQYTTLEAYPVEEAILRQLNYPALVNIKSSNPEASEGLFLKLHAASWDREEMIFNNFALIKKKTMVQEEELGQKRFDLIYFDAFAPGKQPEMWELSVLRKVEQSMNADAVFVTYCAKGQLKRDLKSMGLVVETLPGPPGKKEMVRAVKS